MTDYNDGKWHGWNGGECPVHRESVVEVVTHLHGRIGESKALTKGWWAGHSNPVVAFRVVTPYVEPPKPREWWATGMHLHNSRADADAFLAKVSADNPGMNFDSHAPVLVREVTPTAADPMVARILAEQEGV
jgi:hypothetical protein